MTTAVRARYATPSGELSGRSPRIRPRRLMTTRNAARTQKAPAISRSERCTRRSPGSLRSSRRFRITTVDAKISNDRTGRPERQPVDSDTLPARCIVQHGVSAFVPLGPMVVLERGRGDTTGRDRDPIPTSIWRRQPGSRALQWGRRFEALRASDAEHAYAGCGVDESPRTGAVRS